MVKTIEMLKFVANQIPTYKFATSTKKSTAITCLIVFITKALHMIGGHVKCIYSTIHYLG